MKKRKRVWIFLAAILVIVCAVWMLLLQQGNKPDAAAVPTPVPTEAPTAAPTEVATPTPKVKLAVDANIGNTPTPAPTAPGITIPGWAAMKVPAGATDVDVNLYNPPDNAGWYYLTYELHIEDTDEILFSTGLIPPDMCCTRVTLCHPLEAGEYACIMHVQPYMMDENQSPTNNAVFNMALIVE